MGFKFEMGKDIKGRGVLPRDKFLVRKAQIMKMIDFPFTFTFSLASSANWVSAHEKQMKFKVIPLGLLQQYSMATSLLSQFELHPCNLNASQTCRQNHASAYPDLSLREHYHF